MASAQVNKVRSNHCRFRAYGNTQLFVYAVLMSVDRAMIECRAPVTLQRFTTLKRLPYLTSTGTIF